MTYTLYLLKKDNSNSYYLNYCDTPFFDQEFEMLQAGNPEELLLIKQCEFYSTEYVELVKYLIENLIWYLEVRPNSNWYCNVSPITVEKIKEIMEIQITNEEEETVTS